MDPHHFEKPDPDPHESDKPDSDPHESEKPDPDPHQSLKMEPQRVADAHNGGVGISVKGKIRIRMKVKGWTRIHIKKMNILVTVACLEYVPQDLSGQLLLL